MVWGKAYSGYVCTVSFVRFEGCTNFDYYSSLVITKIGQVHSRSARKRNSGYIVYQQYGISRNRLKNIQSKCVISNIWPPLQQYRHWIAVSIKLHVEYLKANYQTFFCKQKFSIEASNWKTFNNTRVFLQFLNKSEFLLTLFVGATRSHIFHFRALKSDPYWAAWCRKSQNLTAYRNETTKPS